MQNHSGIASSNLIRENQDAPIIYSSDSVQNIMFPSAVSTGPKEGYYTDGSSFGEPLLSDLHFDSARVDQNTCLSEPQIHPDVLLGDQYVHVSEGALMPHPNMVQQREPFSMQPQWQWEASLSDLSSHDSQQHSQDSAGSISVMASVEKNRWFSLLDNKKKRILVEFLQESWGYPMDDKGYRLALKHTRRHIFEKEGTLLFSPKTDPNIIQSIIDGSRPIKLSTEEMRKRFLIHELEEKYQVPNKWANKYVREALDSPHMRETRDEQIIAYLVVKYSESLNHENVDSKASKTKRRPIVSRHQQP